MSTAETVRDLERFTIDAGHDKTSAAPRSASSVSLEPARPRSLVPGARPTPVPGARPTRIFWDWSKVIPPLADPARSGGDPGDAFEVIVPLAAPLQLLHAADQRQGELRQHGGSLPYADDWRAQLREDRRRRQRLWRTHRRPARPQVRGAPLHPPSPRRRLQDSTPPVLSAKEENTMVSEDAAEGPNG